MSGERDAMIDLIRDEIKNVDICESTPAVCLSGGIDSTVVLYHVLNDLMGGRGSGIRTFTVTFGNGKDEREKARRVADFYGTIHREVLITKQDMLSILPFALKHYPFPRYNIWTWILVKLISEEGIDHLFTGEGSDELFGYPDRSFLEGWAGQLVWVHPAWKVACDYYNMSLHTPFMCLQDGDHPVTRFYSPPNKNLLRASYSGILPDFTITQSSTPPSLAFYEMMGMSREELQLEAAKAWLSTR